MTQTAKSSSSLLSDPKFKEFIEAFERIAKAAENVSLDHGRKLSSEFFLTDAVYEPVKQIENVAIDGRDGNKIPLRIYKPEISRHSPILLYLHRGGWVFCNIDEADPVCRKLANRLGCTVVSVEYRLAPENPFPKPLHDCYDALLWTADHAQSLDPHHSGIVLCGESAGGNMAAAAALMARDTNGPEIAAQLLIYPAIRSQIDEKPYQRSADQYFLTKDAMTFFWSMYLQDPKDRKNPYASPDLATDFTGLPPALIITAEYDALREEAEDYAEKLLKGGNKVITKCIPKVIHGFIDLPIYEEEQKNHWIDEIGALLKKLH